MNQLKKEKEVKDFVVQYFIRVCKNHKIYGTFKNSFNKVRHSRDHNPFGNFKNIYDFKERLEQFTEKEYQQHRRTGDKYEKVTMMINHMMHFFLERGGIDPMRLGGIGQEIFDLSCYGIYGDDFLQDMENMKEQHPQPMPQNDMESYLFQLYMKLAHGGRHMMPWVEFKDKYLPQLKREWRQDHVDITNEYEDYETSYDEEPF